MGIFGFLKKRQGDTPTPVKEGPESSQADAINSEPQSEPRPAGDSVLDRIDSLEFSLKSHVSAEASRVSAEMAETFATELRRLTVILETLPASTKSELESLLNQLSRSRTPLAVRT